MTHSITRPLADQESAAAPTPIPASSPPSTSASTTALRALLPGLLVAALGVTGAWFAHAAVNSVGVLTWAVVLGAVVANLGLIPRRADAGLKVAMRRMLRIGVVLLGFSLSLGAIVSLGVPVISLVVTTLLLTFFLTNWLGNRMGVGGPRSLLIATGFAICGASAVAAMEENARADDDDVAAAIAMVTLCGTVAMIGLPLLQAPLGLSDAQLGAWAGASVHEVGQVVGAASAAGAAAVSVAVVVKLTRVLCLAPMVAFVCLAQRRRAQRMGGISAKNLPPIVPLFVLGFILCCLVRSTGAVPAPVLDLVGQVQTVVLGAALFAMGTGVNLKSVFLSSGRALILSGISTLAIAAIALSGVVLLMA